MDDWTRVVQVQGGGRGVWENAWETFSLWDGSTPQLKRAKVTQTAILSGLKFFSLSIFFCLCRYSLMLGLLAGLQQGEMTQSRAKMFTGRCVLTGALLCL